MSKDKKIDLDEMIATLARDEARHAPQPSPELMARVLADAASLPRGQGQAAATPVQAKPAGWTLRGWLGELFGDGWAPGAALAMTLCLAIGIGLGVEGVVDLRDTVLDPDEAEIVLAGADFMGGAGSF